MLLSEAVCQAYFHIVQLSDVLLNSDCVLIVLQISVFAVFLLRCQAALQFPWVIGPGAFSRAQWLRLWPLTPSLAHPLLTWLKQGQWYELAEVITVFNKIIPQAHCIMLITHASLLELLLCKFSMLLERVNENEAFSMLMTGNSRNSNCFSGFHGSRDYFTTLWFHPALLGGSERAEGLPAARLLLFCLVDYSRKREASVLMAILPLVTSSCSSWTAWETEWDAHAGSDNVG